MSLVPSLLRAIVTIDGDALVLHVGDKPYVLSASGQIDLAPRGLTYDAVAGVIAQLLPEESQKALQEYGAAQHELSDLEDFPGEQFSVVAARGGDDVWVEIRRRRQVSPAQTHQEPTADVASGVRHDETPAVPMTPRLASWRRRALWNFRASRRCGQSLPRRRRARPPSPREALATNQTTGRVSSSRNESRSGSRNVLSNRHSPPLSCS